MNTLPQGFQLRQITMNDLQGVTDLLVACDIGDYGKPTSSRATLEAETRSSWEAPDMHLATNAWVVLAPDGTYAGYAKLFVRPDQPEKMSTHPRVHPDYQGRGIGTYLLQFVEQRARALMGAVPQEQRVTLGSWVEGVNQAANTLLVRAAFTPLRTFMRMELDMDEPPPAPQWPAGIAVRTFKQGQDERLVFDADEEIFQDHWGYTPGNFDEWVRLGTKSAAFDPALWFLAMAGDELAGFSLCLLNIGEDINMGFVDDLGVRRPWRKNGLGLALLHHSFGAFYQRGIRHVELSVDTESLTGATRLYERAGMRRAKKYGTRYEKALREGTQERV